ncbi:MAG TPA: hypothetical protein VKV33_09610, partial [Streptosporangiaceae bacterium]|nr:hypothetical protein [Streptosporangiaceae bacterium]
CYGHVFGLSAALFDSACFGLGKLPIEKRISLGVAVCLIGDLFLLVTELAQCDSAGGGCGSCG